MVRVGRIMKTLYRKRLHLKGALYVCWQKYVIFVCLKTDENSDVTTMKVSRHPQVMEDYIEGVTISDLV